MTDERHRDAHDQTSLATEAIDSDHTLDLPKVLFLSHTAQKSGAELALARTIPALQVDAHVLLLANGPLESMLRQLQVRTTVLNVASTGGGRRGGSARAVLSLIVAALKLRRCVRRLDAEIVHGNSLRANVLLCMAFPLRRRFDFVWHVRDTISDDYMSRYLALLCRFLLRRYPDDVIANSRSVAALIPRRSHVIPSPVDLPHKYGSRRTLGTPFRFLMLGRVSPWKGQHLVIEAFRKAFDIDTPVVIDVVGSALFGEDEYETTCRDLAGGDERIRFRGFVDDVWEVLAESDALVHYSTSPEPFGQVVVQGMAAGLPVIAAKAGGPTEIIVDRMTGILVEPSRPDALAAVLAELFNDRQLCRDLGQRASKSVAKYRSSVIGPQIVDVYKKLRSGRAA